MENLKNGTRIYLTKSTSTDYRIYTMVGIYRQLHLFREHLKENKIDEEVRVLDTEDLITNQFEILSEEDEEIECVNAYKLIEAPYMADCLRKGNYDTFTELLKQSEIELVERISDLVEAVKLLNKKNKE